MSFGKISWTLLLRRNTKRERMALRQKAVPHGVLIEPPSSYLFIQRLVGPVFFEPFLLPQFDFLIVLLKAFPDNRLAETSFVTKPLHLPIIKAVQNLERKIDPSGGIGLPLRGPSGCARKPW